MKKIFYLLAVATAMMFTACSSDEKTDWDEYELKGKVKELTIEYYAASHTTSGKMEVYQAEEILFDKKGRKVQEDLYKVYGGNRMLMGSYSYTYEEEDNIKRTTKYRAEHDYEVVETIYEDGRIKEIKEYFCDKLASVIKDFEYNEEGLVTKESVYDDNGKMWSTNEYEYDEQGRETRFISRSRNGRTEMDRTTTYTEDGFKASVVENSYKIEYKYDEEFDKKGNFTSRKIKKDSYGGDIIEKRTIVYY